MNIHNENKLERSAKEAGDREILLSFVLGIEEELNSERLKCSFAKEALNKSFLILRNAVDNMEENK